MNTKIVVGKVRRMPVTIIKKNKPSNKAETLPKSPFIDKIDVNKHGVVRRARVFYLRERRGKSARIKEKRQTLETAR